MGKHTGIEMFSSDGLVIRGHSWEPVEEPRAVICLVHGLGEHSGRYLPFASFMNNQGYQVIGTDLRGHGRSHGTRGHSPSYDLLIADISLLLRYAAEMFPSKPLFLYGHSLGGNLVITHLLRCRPHLAGAIVTSPLLRLTNPPSQLKARLALIISRVLPSLTFSNGMNPSDLSRDAVVIQAYRCDPLVHDRISARLAVDMLEAGELAIGYACDITLPVLLMHGAADAVTSVEATKTFAGNSHRGIELKIWKGMYHELHNEPDREKVLDYISNWMMNILRTNQR